MKKILAALLALACAAAFAGCEKATQGAIERWETTQPQAETGAVDSSVKILRLTHSSGEDSCVNQAALTFKNRLEQLSNGKMQVEVYPGDTMGSLAAAMDDFGNSAVDMRIGTAGNPCQGMIMWLPLLTDLSLQEIEAMMQSGMPLRECFDSTGEQYNVKTLAVFPMQYRMLASKEPVTGRESLRSLNMRSIGVSDTDTLFWGALCNTVKPLQIQNLPLALQQGEVNACDNTLLNLVDYGVADRIAYLTEISCKLYFDVFYIKGDSFAALSEEQQGWVCAAAEDTQERMQQFMQTKSEQAAKKMQEQGVVFSKIPESERQQIRAETSALILNRQSIATGEELTQEILRLAADGVPPAAEG